VRLLAIVEYDGTDFVGFQVQARGAPRAGEQPRTVQAELERALAEVSGEAIRVIGSGRTDAGVHAAGQVIHLDSAAAIFRDPRQAVRAVNAHLPPDVAVQRLRPVSDDFHARFSATRRCYSYRIVNAGAPAPISRRFAHVVHAPLDPVRMADGAQHLLGSHDFVAFGAQEGPGSTRRDVYAAAVTTRTALEWSLLAPIWHTQESGSRDQIAGFADRGAAAAAARAADQRDRSLIEIRLEANAFLRHMVRRIVGTLVRVGAGRLDPGDVAAILASGEKGKAGPAVPANGLCLERVQYAGFDP
jgi:tRNA pseudouridine38-40 synthase